MPLGLDLRIVALFKHLAPLISNLLLLLLAIFHALNALFLLLKVHLGVILGHLLGHFPILADLCMHFGAVVSLLTDFF